MQKQTIQSISPVSESTSGAMPVERYSVRQRLLSASLSLAMTGSVGVSSALANAPAINANLAPSSNSFAHATVSHSLSSALNSAAVTHNAAAVSLNLHSATSGLHPLSGFVPGAHSMTGFNRSSLVTPGVLRSVVQNAASQANGGQDLNLASAAPIFRAGGLAGLHQITLLIGGKEQVFSTDSKFTAAELVAAQQVMSGSKQTITINGQGVATGGSFDLSGSTLSALDKAVGGNLNSLVISHGVNVVDSLSSLNLSGSLVNMGSIVLGADAGAKGQLVDSINAANIYNGYGGVIASSTALSALSPTGIALAASNTFFNSGVVNSSSTLNVSAPTIVNAAPAAASGIVHAGTLSAKQDVTLTTQNLTNTGLITSSTGNVTINNGGGDNNIVVNGAGGTVQATNGNISFNQAGYAGSGNLSVNGGDYLSKQVNFNAGTGAIDANVGEITGEVNGTAGSSHVIAATNNLNLGTICVSGDPTYYNTAGDITISGALTGDPDLALIASGNIIGNGGSLDTSAATVSKTIAGTVNGGNILLVAGAHFTGVTGSIVTPPGDTSSTITLDGTASPTGGYIDLSGTVFTGSSTNKSVTAITSSGGTTGNGGNITMVAFQGTAKNSGGLIGSSNGGSVLVDASGKAGGTGGNVTMIGSGQFVFATEVVGASLTALGGKASVTAPIDVTKGAATGGTFIVAPGSETNTTVQFGSIFTSGAVNIDTAGLVNLAGVTHAGSANITSTKGFVEASILNTAGAGGVTNLTTMNGGAGGDGGNITVHAATGMFFNIVDASGAGGA
ncbi:MAG: hypothetical protein KGS72_15855, partial [Cyanobacteria bacterium REEB67]|nr:hypothetical protein [Cyanobacteria bacterium REEB67]